jgi:hypothetical protein
LCYFLENVSKYEFYRTFDALVFNAKVLLEYCVTCICNEDSYVNFVERIFMQLIRFRHPHLLFVWVILYCLDAGNLHHRVFYEFHCSWMVVEYWRNESSCTVSSSSIPLSTNDCPQSMQCVVLSASSTLSSVNHTFVSCPF